MEMDFDQQSENTVAVYSDNTRKFRIGAFYNRGGAKGWVWLAGVEVEIDVIDLHTLYDFGRRLNALTPRPEE